MKNSMTITPRDEDARCIIGLGGCTNPAHYDLHVTGHSSGEETVPSCRKHLDFFIKTILDREDEDWQKHNAA